MSIIKINNKIKNKYKKKLWIKFEPIITTVIAGNPKRIIKKNKIPKKGFVKKFEMNFIQLPHWINIVGITFFIFLIIKFIFIVIILIKKIDQT